MEQTAVNDLVRDYPKLAKIVEMRSQLAQYQNNPSYVIADYLIDLTADLCASLGGQQPHGPESPQGGGE